jgi:hypothetical protein
MRDDLGTLANQRVGSSFWCSRTGSRMVKDATQVASVISSESEENNGSHATGSGVFGARACAEFYVATGVKCASVLLSLQSE